MPAVFDHEYVKRITGPNMKPKGSKMDHAEMLMDDIRKFKESRGCDRLAMIWCGSTEVFHRPAAVHATLKDFECGLQKNDPEISPSQIYAYAALKMGVPYANGAPHLTVDAPGADGAGARPQCSHLRQRLQNRPDFHEDADRAGPEIAHAGRGRLVLHQHPGQPRRRGSGRSGLLQVQGRIEVVGARTNFTAGPLPGSVQRHLS